MTEKRRSRVRALSAFVVIVLSLGAAFLACDEAKRSNGEECLKNMDCLSETCVAQRCAPSPPLAEGNGNASDGGVDGSNVDAGDAGGGNDAASDTSTGSDAASDGDGPAADAGSDTGIGDARADGDGAPSDAGAG